MGLSAEGVRHDRKHGMGTERIALERPELAIAVHDEVSIDVAIGSTDVEIEVYWEVVILDHGDRSLFGITLTRAYDTECTRDFPFGIILAAKPRFQNICCVTSCIELSFGVLLKVAVFMYQSGEEVIAMSCHSDLFGDFGEIPRDSTVSTIDLLPSTDYEFEPVL